MVTKEHREDGEEENKRAMQSRYPTTLLGYTPIRNQTQHLPLPNGSC